MKKVTLALGLIAGLAGAALADEKLATSERTFAVQAAQGDRAEIRLANLARERGSSQTVKDFARRMIDDHTKANEELTAIAKKLGFALPEEPSEGQQEIAQRLEGLSGAAFDREYANVMVQEHKKVVAIFIKGRDATSSPQLKAFIVKTLPILEHHLEMAEEMLRKVGKSQP